MELDASWKDEEKYIWDLNILIDYYKEQNDLKNIKKYLILAVGEGDASSKKRLTELEEKYLKQ